jgi:tetratricopeptide (TPR) repeat protein
MVKELNVVLSIDSTHEEALTYKEKIKDYLIKQETDKLYTLAYKYYYDDKDVEKANNELQKLLSLNPDHKEANTLYKTISKEIKKMYLQKVGQMVNKDKLDVNNTALKKLIEIKAQDQVVEIRRLYDNKQYSEALVSVDAVLEQEPENEHALELKKLILDAQGLEKAELKYNEALKLFNEKKLEETESKIVETLDLSPNHEKAKMLLNDVRKILREKNLTAAMELMKSGKREDLEAAQKIVEEYLSVDKENTQAKKILVDIQSELLIKDANAYIDNDEYEKANKAIQKALTLNPDSKKVQEAFKNMKDVLDVFEDEE